MKNSVNAVNSVYTLRRGNKTVSLLHFNRHYVIGFKNLTMMRKVHYSIDPEPNILIMRETNIDLHKDLHNKGYDLNLTLDVSATLFIPKCRGSTLEPMNDGGFHIHEYKENDFLELPIKKNLGVVLPYHLECEDDDEFVFKACVIDPMS
jgi:hypothetical protein